MKSFEKCLKEGHIYETKSINILKKHKFKDITIDYKKNSYYDLTAYKKNKKVYIEVKYNSLTDRTKYIFLECCKTNLYPSGISITKSDYYIFFSNSKYWICKTDKVKKLLEQTIRRELNKIKLTKPSDEQLLKYIEYSGLRTKNTIGILLLVDDVNKICKYKGTHNNVKRLF